MAIIKSTATPCFFVGIVSWGVCPKPRPKDFSGKVLWKLKIFAQIKWYVRQEILWLTFLIRKVSWGVCPKPDQRTFREKSFGNSKAFAQIKWYIRCEILWLTFLIRKGKLTFRMKRVYNLKNKIIQRAGE